MNAPPRAHRLDAAEGATPDACNPVAPPYK